MFGGMLGLDQRVVFLRELATMVNSGISLGEALGLLSTRPGSPELRASITEAAKRVSSGERFSDVMERYPKVYTRLNCAMVRAGEESGRLDENLNDAADYLEREVQLRQMISRETFYPKILLVAVLIIPLATQVAIAWLTGSPAAAFGVLGKALLSYLGLAVVIVGLVVAYQQLRKSEQGAQTIDRLKLRIPVVGAVISQLSWSKVCRAISALYKAGLSSNETLRLAGQSSGNRSIEAMVRQAIPHVQKGTPLSEALTKGGYVPDLPLRMLQTGEQTGDIDMTLEKVADYFEEQSKVSLQRMSLLITPIVIVIMGVVVLMMAAQSYGGYFNEMLNGE